jgi:predicted lipoprotein with Yx(FWY)xxD motif
MAVLAAVILAACSSGDGGDGRQRVEAGQAPTLSRTPFAQTAQVPPQPVVLTDASGMTLYFLDQDTPTESRCNDQCAQNWLPVRPSPDLQGQEKFSILTRLDGTRQLVFDGRPLYTCISDTKPGDVNCDGQMGVFHALRY